MAKAAKGTDDFPVNGDRHERRHWFKTQLEDHGREDCILLAGRAALRVLPFLLPFARTSADGDIARSQRGDRWYHLLVLLRCNVLFVVASLAPTTERNRFATTTTAAAAAATTDAATTDAAAIAAAAAAAYATTAAAAAYATAAATTAAAAATAATAAAYAYATPSAVAVAYAFLADLAMLDGNDAARRRLALAPLWPDATPPHIAKAWNAFATDLRAMGGDFDIWADWYGGGEWNGKPFPGVLEGTKPRGPSLFGLPRKKALKAWRDIALIADEFWTEPARVNAEMKRIVAMAREEELRAENPDDEDEKISPEQPIDQPVRPIARRKTGSVVAKTTIGRAILENADTLALQSHLLISIIDDEIQRLKRQLPNSSEAQKELADKLERLEELKDKTISLCNSVIEFQEGNGSEANTVKSANAFFKPFAEMWSEKGKEFAEIGTRSIIFIAASGMAIACGASPLLAGTVIGAIAAGKPLAEVLKAAKGVFKIWGN